MNNEQRKSAYTIRTTGSKPDTFRGFRSSATGDYVLLRATASQPGLKVDPRSGLLGGGK
jgi:hypothetical protein